MSRCELSGKGPEVKNLVSHSNIKTKSRAFPNIQSKKFTSETLGQRLSFKVSTSTLRTIERIGGFDRYILKQNDSCLSKRALTVKNKVARKLRSKKS